MGEKQGKGENGGENQKRLGDTIDGLWLTYSCCGNYYYYD